MRATRCIVGEQSGTPAGRVHIVAYGHLLVYPHEYTSWLMATSWCTPMSTRPAVAHLLVYPHEYNVAVAYGHLLVYPHEYNVAVAYGHLLVYPHEYTSWLMATSWCTPMSTHRGLWPPPGVPP
ncbi:unnamed protein product [Boreogadus saida]